MWFLFNAVILLGRCLIMEEWAADDLCSACFASNKLVGLKMILDWSFVICKIRSLPAVNLQLCLHFYFSLYSLPEPLLNVFWPILFCLPCLNFFFLYLPPCLSCIWSDFLGLIFLVANYQLCIVQASCRGPCHQIRSLLLLFLVPIWFFFRYAWSFSYYPFYLVTSLICLLQHFRHSCLKVSFSLLNEA